MGSMVSISLSVAPTYRRLGLGYLERGERQPFCLRFIIILLEYSLSLCPLRSASNWRATLSLPISQTHALTKSVIGWSSSTHSMIWQLSARNSSAEQEIHNDNLVVLIQSSIGFDYVSFKIRMITEVQQGMCLAIHNCVCMCSYPIFRFIKYCCWWHHSVSIIAGGKNGFYSGYKWLEA